MSTAKDEMDALSLSAEEREPLLSLVDAGDDLDSAEDFGGRRRLRARRCVVYSLRADVASDGSVRADRRERVVKMGRFLKGRHVSGTVTERNDDLDAWLDALAAEEGVTAAEMRRRMLEFAKRVYSPQGG
jgi:hypothetical protein